MSRKGQEAFREGGISFRYKMKLIFILFILFVLLVVGVFTYKWVLANMPLSVWKWLGFMAIMMLFWWGYKTVKGWFFRDYEY